ncbi:UNVERIFIED_CONTAM: hypothetical protein RMT77_004987 [Armadillidium vulgare]
MELEVTKLSSRRLAPLTYNEKNGNLSAFQNEKAPAPPNTAMYRKAEEEKVWDDLIGEEKKWEDMTTSEKVKRVTINIIKVICVLTLLYFFICSLDLLSSSFRLISGKSTSGLLNNDYISNPIVGLMIGILVTVLVQSSSTSTSIIVSMVASGIITVHDAIPMIFGSNIGTSVTNTIVSLTQLGDKEQFRRAFGGATVHDMFNWLCVIVLLIIEVLTGVLETLTGKIVNSLRDAEGAEFELLSALTNPFVDLIIQLDSTILRCWGMDLMQSEDSMIKKYCKTIDTLGVATTLAPTYNASIPKECQASNNGVPHSCHFLFYERSLSDTTVGIILLLISLTILCTTLVFIVKILNSMLKGSIAKVINKVINADIPYVPWLTGYIAILIGAVLTFVVQSSSVFTSTLTPLIGLGIITVERAYPLTLGSNLGTTTTALLAAMAAEGDKTNSIQIALVHTFFNIFGILIFYPIPFMRWPVPLAKALGNITAEYRWFAIFYLITMFFVLPGAIFALSLGGMIVMWSILGPVIIIVVFAVIINLIQKKKRSLLPTVLQNWNFLPKPLRSLEPYDRVVTSLPCCSKCKVSPQDDEVQEVISHSNNSIQTKQGIDNPVLVRD